MKSIINMSYTSIEGFFSKKNLADEEREDQLLNSWSSLSSRWSNNSIGVEIETYNG